MIDIKILKKLANIKVLIVEDDELTAKMISQSLSLYCKEVFVAYDGIMGFDFFEKYKPNVVISDINMPEMNGLDMVKSMHEISPHLPVIIMTSYDSTENMMESINQRAYSYLRKPLKIEELQLSLLMATKDIYNLVVYLKNDFLYDCNNKSLYLKDKLINLTKTEQKLVNLLISNIDKIVDYSTIENFVWEEKSMSSEALRMCIKKIRKKTYSSIIENVQGFGYKINSKNL